MPWTKDQVTLVVAALIKAALDAVDVCCEDPPPPPLEHARAAVAAVDQLGASLSIFYAAVTGDGLGTTDAVDGPPRLRGYVTAFPPARVAYQTSAAYRAAPFPKPGRPEGYRTEDVDRLAGEWVDAYFGVAYFRPSPTFEALTPQERDALVVAEIGYHEFLCGDGRQAACFLSGVEKGMELAATGVPQAAAAVTATIHTGVRREN